MGCTVTPVFLSTQPVKVTTFGIRALQLRFRRGPGEGALWTRVGLICPVTGVLIEKEKPEAQSHMGTPCDNGQRLEHCTQELRTTRKAGSASRRRGEERCPPSPQRSSLPSLRFGLLTSRLRDRDCLWSKPPSLRYPVTAATGKEDAQMP